MNYFRHSAIVAATNAFAEECSRAIAPEFGASRAPFAFASARNEKAIPSDLTSSLVAEVDEAKAHVAATIVAFGDDAIKSCCFRCCFDRTRSSSRTIF